MMMETLMHWQFHPRGNFIAIESQNFFIPDSDKESPTHDFSAV
jgi:hypothetical protein